MLDFDQPLTTLPLPHYIFIFPQPLHVLIAAGCDRGQRGSVPVVIDERFPINGGHKKKKRSGASGEVDACAGLVWDRYPWEEESSGCIHKSMGDESLRVASGEISGLMSTCLPVDVVVEKKQWADRE